MCTRHVWDALGTLAVGPSLAHSDCPGGLPGTRTGARPTHFSAQFWESVGLLPASRLPPAYPIILQTPGLLQALGSLMGEAGEARAGNRVRPSIPLWQHRASSCFVVCGADVTSSGQSLFLSWVGQVSGPPDAAQGNPTIMAW